VDGAWYNYDPAPAEIMQRVARIEAVCASHNVLLRDAAIQFPLHHPCVVSMIPGGQAVDQVTDNRRAIDTAIPDALWADLKSNGLLRQDAPTP
jgi:D-threo-aldose 1-dehydrogenase